MTVLPKMKPITGRGTVTITAANALGVRAQAHFRVKEVEPWTQDAPTAWVPMFAIGYRALKWKAFSKDDDVRKFTPACVLQLMAGTKHHGVNKDFRPGGLDIAAVLVLPTKEETT